MWGAREPGATPRGLGGADGALQKKGVGKSGRIWQNAGLSVRYQEVRGRVMKVIIAGSRHIEDYGALCAAIEGSGFEISQVYSGGCRGVDAMGERWAGERGIPVRQFPADWATHGRIAGELRNREMARLADAMVILWDGKSPGASCMFREAARAGIRIHNQIHGVDMAELAAMEQAIMRHYWSGRDRLIYVEDHWSWEHLGDDAPPITGTAVENLRALGMLEEVTFRALKPVPENHRH